MNEAEEPKIQKSISHLEDLKPEEFLKFLEKYKDLPISGGIEVSEKVDGSARITFGVENGRLWTQSKNGQKKYGSSEYPDIPMFKSLKTAHVALESKKQNFINWYKKNSKGKLADIFFIAEVLYTKIPNAIEYGPNVIMIHGVMTKGDVPDEAMSKKIAESLIGAVGSELSDGKEGWKFEYKRIINPKDVMVDVKKEYTSIKQIYDELKSLEPNKLKASGKPAYKAALEKFKTIQLGLKKKLVGQLRKQQSVYGPKGGDVEGIVFRELDSGNLIKLVDKEYFTKLNKFLWHYRELLNKGANIGDEWQFGIMQKFRNYMADDVIGAPVAKTPGFVNHLKSFGTNLKFPATVNNPEKKADYIIAQFIKKNGLLEGDFLAKFSGSLKKVEGEFTKLKKEWDSKKKKEMSVDIEDDDGNVIKKIKMDDLIKGRTDDSFTEMEDFFKGVNQALSTISSMRGDLTKKTAMIKVVLGQNRLSKLQDSGGSDNKADESRLREATPPPIPKDAPAAGPPYASSQKASSQKSTMDTDENVSKVDIPTAKKLLKKYKNLLKSKKNLDVGDNPAVFGSGTRGVAFNIGGNRALKVTADKQEAVAANKLKNLKLKHVYRVDDVFRLRDEHVYCIVQEALTKMPGSSDDASSVTGMAAEFNKALIETGFPVFINRAAYDWDKAKELVKAYVHKKIKSYPKDTQMARFEEHNKLWNDLASKWHVKDMVKELASAGVKFHDYHAGNIMMRKDGTPVLIDIGYSKVEGGDEPDVLEKIIREMLLKERKADKIGVTIGRFQPFHMGHATIIRNLANKFNKVIVIVAGNTQDKKNPFSYETRLELMKKSLPDVSGKIEIYKATMGGKNSGYLPGVISDIIKDHSSSVQGDTAINIMIGPDRFDEIKKQIEHARKAKEQGNAKDMVFNPDLVTVSKLDGVKNDDDTDRISGTKVRQAIMSNDKKTVANMMDPHLVSNHGEFKTMFAKMRKELSMSETKNHINEEEWVDEALGDIGGEAGVQKVLQANAAKLKAQKGIDVSKAKQLGFGAEGIAFDIGGKVLKITSDVEEAKTCNLLKEKGKSLKYVSKIYDVFRFADTPDIDQPVYGIVEEHLTELSAQEKKEFRDVESVISANDIIDVLATKSYQEIENAIRDYFNTDRIKKRFSSQTFSSTAPGKKGVTSKPASSVGNEVERILQLMKKYNLDKIIPELRSVGIQFADFHSGNMMKRGSVYVINDLGHSRGADKEPVTLEGIIEHVMTELAGGGAMFTGPGSADTTLRRGSSAWSSHMSKITDPEDETGDRTHGMRGLQLHISHPEDNDDELNKFGGSDMTEKRVVDTNSSQFERMIAIELNSNGIHAEPTGDTTSLPDVKVEIDNVVSYVEVKMSHEAQLVSSRFKFDGDRWVSAGGKHSPFITYIEKELNSSPDVKKFVDDLKEYISSVRKTKVDRIKIVTSSSVVAAKDPEIVNRDEMEGFIRSSSRDQYIFKKDNVDVTDLVQGHYLEGKSSPADYMQMGDDFYVMGHNNPLGVPDDVPQFTGFGRVAIRLGMRTKRYEVQPDVKTKKPPKSPYSIMQQSGKKFPFPQTLKKK